MKEEMTPRERVLAALAGKEHDRPPLISPVSLANEDCMKISHAYFPYANINSQKMAALAETSYTVLKFDSIMPYFGITCEASAFGCDVSWGSSERMPVLHRGSLHTLSDFKKPNNYLDQKPIRTIINAISLLKTRYHDHIAIVGKILGPLSLLAHLFGAQNTMISLIIEPEGVKEVLDEIKDLCIDFARAQLAAGADVITISEDAAGDLISRECYRVLLMETEKDLVNAIKDDTFTIFHLNCDITDKADLFCATGFHALSYDSRNDLQHLKTLVGEMKLVGGVNNPRTLLNGEKNDIIQEVNYALRNGVSLIAPEAAIPLRVRNDNLLAMRDAINEYDYG